MIHLYVQEFSHQCCGNHAERVYIIGMESSESRSRCGIVSLIWRPFVALRFISAFWSSSFLFDNSPLSLYILLKRHIHEYLHIYVTLLCIIFFSVYKTLRLCALSRNIYCVDWINFHIISFRVLPYEDVVWFPMIHAINVSNYQSSQVFYG